MKCKVYLVSLKYIRVERKRREKKQNNIIYVIIVITKINFWQIG